MRVRRPPSARRRLPAISPPTAQGCFDMTEWEATRHLGFGSATVLKKLVGGCKSRGGWLKLLTQARHALRISCGILLASLRHHA